MASNNRQQLWRKDQVLRDTTGYARAWGSIRQSSRTKQLEAIRQRFPVTAEGSWAKPPFELKQGEWTVWLVKSPGEWKSFRTGLSMIASDRYASWLRDHMPDNEATAGFNYIARMYAPGDTP